MPTVLVFFIIKYVSQGQLELKKLSMNNAGDNSKVTDGHLKNIGFSRIWLCFVCIELRYCIFQGIPAWRKREVLQQWWGEGGLWRKHVWNSISSKKWFDKFQVKEKLNIEVEVSMSKKALCVYSGRCLMGSRIIGLIG